MLLVMNNAKLHTYCLLHYQAIYFRPLFCENTITDDRIKCQFTSARSRLKK